MSYELETLIEDEYFHEDLTLEYCLENILYEPEIKTNEFSVLKNLFNSVLLNNCCCIENCNAHKCIHGKNYKQLSEEFEKKELVLSDNSFNKDLIYECSKLCKCSNNCENRLVQYGPRKNLIIMPAKFVPHQKGLFTNKKIPKGAFICEYAGEILTRTEALKRDKDSENIRLANLNNKLENTDISNYIICLKENSLDKQNKTIETFIDPNKIGNIGRYINHSCDPNCKIISVRIDCPIPKLAIFSKRTIEAYEELYFHYGGEMLHMNLPPNPVKCLCSSENCQNILPGLEY